MDSQIGTVTQIAERQLSKLEALIPGGKKTAIIVLAAVFIIAYVTAVAAS
jgi:hypothetical protein